jgi:hypothetical protein
VRQDPWLSRKFNPERKRRTCEYAASSPDWPPRR